MTVGTRAGHSGAPRPDASMSLLTQVMTDTVDEGYAEAARRRANEDAAGEPPQRGWTGPGLFVGLLLIGLVLAGAVVEVRERATATNEARSALLDEVQRRVSAVDAAAADLAVLRADIGRMRDEALAAGGAPGAATGEQLERLELASGSVPVEGPGLTVTIDDAEPVDGPPRAEDRVLDRDLQSLVNGLWAAGAEAVSVNDQRLTSLSAIRSADIAILVDYRPLLPPYVVRAVGDARAMEPAFADSTAGRELRLLVDNYGFRFDVARTERLRLPGAAALSLRTARSADTAPGP